MRIIVEPKDPWESAPDPRSLSHRQRRELAPADVMPGVWPALPRAVRRRLAALCARVHADHPEEENVNRLVAFVVGALHTMVRGADDPLDVAGRAYVARFAIGDAAERREWRAVEDAIVGSATIMETIIKLRARCAATVPA